MVLDAVTSGQRETFVLAVQMVEVEGKLVSSGSLTPQQVRARLHGLGQLLEALPFGREAQQAASFHYARRKPYNLSLGDALCLGAAEALGADVMTAEHGWATLPDLPFEVQLIRWPT